MKCLTKQLLLTFIICISAFSSIVTDSYIGYSFNLPENWTREIKSSSHHVFYDTTATYCSYINIVMSDFSNDTIYKSSEDWTRAHFLANLITIRSSITATGTPLTDPFGAVAYYDSATAVQSGKKAMEMYATFYSSSADGNWSEFVRYTSVNKKGYEIYTIGDTADMKKNIGYYIALTDLMKLDTNTTSLIENRIVSRKFSVTRIGNVNRRILDLMGRDYGKYDFIINDATGFRIHNKKKILQLNR